MSVILPDWVAHVDPEKKKRQTIFSVDAHPDGTRIATGGLDAKVRIWATGPLLDEKQDNDQADKLLSTLSRHAGSVLVVRWSRSGTYLASGSDDTVALVWELDPSGAGSFAFGSSEKNVETYRCSRRLTGHESDVTDLAWSPHDEFLATVGLDSKVCVYSGYSFERIRKLDGHQGFVKGVVWDSVGHFLASASDDKTVKVWRVSDWGLEAEVKAPFITSPNSPFFRRPSWSPDGAHLLTANAMNGPVFVASVITRGPWSSEVSLVGHENAVSVTAFNPRLFRGTDTPTSVATVLALGSIDQSISVWVTGHPRPVLVFKDVFERQVTDLSWSADGLVLYASSADGSLAVFQFTHDQLPHFATDRELENARNVFGYRRPQMNGHGHAPAPRPALGASASTPSRQSTLPVTLLPDGTPVRLQQQITMKNGKRRIRPTLMGGGDAPAADGPSASAAVTASNQHGREASSSSMSIAALTNGLPGGAEFGTRGVKRKAEDELPFVGMSGYNAAAGAGAGTSLGGALTVADNVRMPRPPPSAARSAAREAGATLGGQVQREKVPSAYAVPLLTVSRDVGRRGGAARAAAGASVSTMGDLLPLPGVPAYFRVEQAGCLLDIRNFDGSGSRPAEIAQLELPSENGQERVLWIDFSPVIVVAATITPSFSAIVTADRNLAIYSAKGRKVLNATLDALPYALQAAGKYLLIVTVLGDLLRWDVESLTQLGAPLSIASIVPGASGSSGASSSALATRPNPSSSSSSAAAAVAVDIYVYTNGAPILIVPAAEKAYTLDSRTGALVCIADGWAAEHSVYWDASLHTRLSVSGGSGSGTTDGLNALLWHEPVKTIEAEINALVQARGGRSRSRFPPPPPAGAQGSGLEAAVSLRHLETRLLGCELLESAGEYRSCLVLYAQRLAEDGIRNMAEDLIRSLLGPVYYRPGAMESWQPEILGMSKRALLAQVLNTMASGRLQALAEQYQDILRAVMTP
ncbi:HIR complex subunit, partial [Tilletia horrida]